MPKVFILDRHNYEICLQYGLFGVPDTPRAISQIRTVRKEDILFAYLTKEKQLVGLFEADSDVFQEASPERGPWIGRTWDKKKGFYPHRIRVKALENLSQGIGIDDLERMDIGVKENKFRGNSVVSLTEEQADTIKGILRGINVNTPQTTEFGTRKFVDKQLSPKSGFEIGEEKERKLQLLVQENITTLEDGLNVFDTYYNVRDYLGGLGYEGEIDILAKDLQRSYVVVELKWSTLPKYIWSQVFNYTYAIRNTIARGLEVRAMIVCKELGRDTKYAYPELKRKLEDKNGLKVFKYQIDEDLKRIYFEEEQL